MKRYRMAVVGLHFGKWLIDNEIIKGYAAPYFELAAVCDRMKYWLMHVRGSIM